jgi:hypothetical protein
MKYLYLISQRANNSYGAIRSAVVSASSEEEAKTIHPAGDGREVPKESFKGYCMGVAGWFDQNKYMSGGYGIWTGQDNVHVKLISEATRVPWCFDSMVISAIEAPPAN